MSNVDAYRYADDGNIVPFPEGDGHPKYKQLPPPPLASLIRSRNARRRDARRGRGPGRRRAVSVSRCLEPIPMDIVTVTLVPHRLVPRMGRDVVLYLPEWQRVTPDIEEDLIETVTYPSAVRYRRARLRRRAEWSLRRDPVLALLADWFASGREHDVARCLAESGGYAEALAAVRLALANDREQRKAMREQSAESEVAA